MKRQPSCSVIVKTHNSQKVIGSCLYALRQQTVQPDRIIIVDSASENPSYLDKFSSNSLVQTRVVCDDIGFCKGNNLGYSMLPENSSYVLFLNPDAFVSPNTIGEMVEFMEAPENHSVGIATGILYGYDVLSDCPNGRFDSTGVFRVKGRWKDRSQGKAVESEQYHQVERVPAICGAFMFCRKKALEQVLLRDREVFDSDFFMYKEDVDLSLRVRNKGWELALLPWVAVHHCRGWNPVRSKVCRKNRLLSAKNDVRIDLKTLSPYLLFSIPKYLAVKLLDI